MQPNKQTKAGLGGKTFAVIREGLLQIPRTQVKLDTVTHVCDPGAEAERWEEETENPQSVLVASLECLAEDDRKETLPLSRQKMRQAIGAVF